MSEELKPCPFCGGKHLCDGATVEDLNQPNERELYSVYCFDCGGGTRYRKTVDEAYAAWNTRAERTCHMRECHDWQDEWEPYGIYCSECEEFVPDWNSEDNKPIPKYCPNCGAKVVCDE
jgi:Lar family restriction alleviation protein